MKEEQRHKPRGQGGLEKTRWRRCLPLWEAEEVSCVVTTKLKFLSVASASVLGTAVCGAGGVTLGSRDGAGGTGTVVPKVEEMLRLPVVAFGEILAAVVGGGFGAVVETVPGVLMLSLFVLGVVPSSGPAVGALVGLLGEVDTVVGGSEKGKAQRNLCQINFLYKDVFSVMLRGLDAEDSHECNYKDKTANKS